MRERLIKTTFTAGELSSDLLGRGDIRSYDNGAAKLRNVFIHPTGGVSRRSGLRYIDSAAGDGRLISFEFNTDQTYLIVLTNLRMDIYADGALVTTLIAPWNAGQVKQVVWTQSADTLLLTHPDLPPKKLTRGSGGIWALSDWIFYAKDNIVYQPYYKFADVAVTVTPSNTSGTITLTASAAVFGGEHVNTRLRVTGKEVLITTVNSPTVVTVTVIQTLPNTNATIDWEEQSFSPVRGYPVSVAFHQDRLVIGGSRDLPNRLWFSCSGDLFNFDLGGGEDDRAIEFGILSDQVNAIRGVFSGRHLQIFTSGAEWMATGDPLTPTNVQIKRQTRVGSYVSRYIPPVDVDGATLFAARNGQEIRQFMYTDLEDAYSATDVSLLSRHVIGTPADQDFDQKRRLLFVVREDGKFATLTMYRAEAVSAWTLHETNGAVKSVTVAGEIVYMLIERGGDFLIEQIDDALYLDCALAGEASAPTDTWSGLDHLEGHAVSIAADGRVEASRDVSGGQVILDEAASIVQIGLPYTHIIEPLPVSIILNAGQMRAVRLIEAAFRLKNTSALKLDVGRGLRDIPLRQFNEDEILDAAMPQVSGDIKVRAFGWERDQTKSLWRIEQDLPLPFSLLAVNMEIATND
ncbi:MAG: hypothetical protein DI586_02505 [Micavibrio aeruginosavorus]|uniref:Uncharacterized protein n=1 Tax=Micavibrio aeruginosavorus TaxID=349221 RepID=A0A2W5FL98_9BACT|nr:MAG: hypothetical protein DI586_02505 [Micavibrio aeruginosavorus]